MSAHYMQGYMIWAAGRSSPSFLPMMVAHLLILEIEAFLEISMTVDQYSSGLLLISSEAQRNFTLARFIPAALQTSTKYLPTT
jgi:hypothetical protein